MPCDPDGRDEMGVDRVGIEVARDVVQNHLPGVEPTPSILDTCLYTVCRMSSLYFTYSVTLIDM